jgi:uncharacterized cupin superfamily protein
MNKIDVANAPVRAGSRYPKPYDEPCQNKLRRRLGTAAGLKTLGINLLELEPGAWSSQLHWHTLAEEFVLVLEGEVVLVTGGGEELLCAGDCAGFAAGHPNGHHLQNRSQRRAVILEVGPANLAHDESFYPGIDLKATASGYSHADGTPY